MINFLCSHCGAPLRVRPELAGSTSPCPRCHRPIQAPEQSGGTDGVSAALPRAEPPPQTRGAAETAGAPQDATKVPAPSAPSRPATAREAKPSFETASAARDGDLDFLAPPQAPDELGRLGTYRVLKVLGTGAMGIVLLAEDITLRRQVALKVMKKAQAVQEVNRLRFIREAQAAAAIEHDHIIPIYQVGQDRGVPFLAMKLLRGESLEDRLNCLVRLPAEEVIRIGQEIAEGLAEAHERGLIHRDIKPANIWLEEGRDRVKIVDFGLCQRDDENDPRLTQANYMVGTPMYMSPEQAEAVEVDARCDLFSLGSVLYRMCTGELPFAGKTTMAVLKALATKKPRPPIELNPNVPLALSNLILRLLEKKADDRPRTARLVMAALTEIREAPAGYEEVEEELVELQELEEPEDDSEEEEPEVVEVEVVEEVVEVEPVKPKGRPKRTRQEAARESHRRGKRHLEDTDVGALERRVIKLAIVAGVFVFLLLAFLIVKNRFFPKKTAEASPPVRLARAQVAKMALTLDKRSFYDPIVPRSRPARTGTDGEI